MIQDFVFLYWKLIVNGYFFYLCNKDHGQYFKIHNYMYIIEELIRRVFYDN